MLYLIVRVLIVGCGYVGLPLGIELVRQGHQVFGIRRNPESASLLRKSGIEPIIADITNPEDLSRLPASYDWVVNLVSASRGGDYQQTYLQGTQNLIQWLSACPPKKFIYTSSTSVYGQNDGALVNESSPAEPQTETARILVETEKVLLEAATTKKFPALILRAAGIYGAGRGHYFLEYLLGNAKIPGRGDRILNMIHRDDLIGIIIAALKSGRAGQIYNAVDEEPVPLTRFYRWLSETLGSPMPPSVPESAEAERKRGSTNKKVSNRKLKMELGYRFIYPSFRNGCTAEIQRLDEAGQV